MSGFYEQHHHLNTADQQAIRQLAQARELNPTDGVLIRRAALDAALKLGCCDASQLVKQAAIIEAYLRGDEAC